MRVFLVTAVAALADAFLPGDLQQHFSIPSLEDLSSPLVEPLSYLSPHHVVPQTTFSGDSAEHNIFQLHGQLSHYFSNPTGFGVDEFPLPHGAEITHLHMLHRHGARYPTGNFATVDKLQKSKFSATGDLEFLNTWKYKLGLHVLVPLGRKELFDSGVQHKKLYGRLYPKDGSKIVARSTTQSRMTESAECFLSGFFGKDWTNNVTLELIIEQNGFNNSLAGYYKCPNSGKSQSFTGSSARYAWAATYLKDAVKRLNKLIDFDDYSTKLSTGDVYSFQSLCAYETVALGHSHFCNLFTYDEWQGYEYSIDISFSGDSGFQSPTGRGVGIGYVQELRARLKHHYLTKKGGPANTTLDSAPETFPLNQTLYLDFSHDTNIMSILTAMGLTQFNKHLPPERIIDHDLIVSHVTPFAARLDMEIIASKHPVPASRSTREHEHAAPAASGGETTYIHFLLNERTIPLGRSYRQCGVRDDGWCELGAFLEAIDAAYEESQYDYACFGEYETVPYGAVTNGVPIRS